MGEHVLQTFTSADRIAEILRDRIVSGQLSGNTPLRQDHIAEEFGTSHVPVREAFQRLEAQGLVISQPRRGVKVTPINPATIKEMVEMRCALEVLALKHAAPKLKAEHLQAIEAAQLQCNNATSLAEWDAANRKFHESLVDACEMPRLLATLQMLWLTNSRFVFAVGQVRTWQPHSDQDHSLIIDALRSSNFERAAMLLGRHINSAERIGFPATLN